MYSCIRASLKIYCTLKTEASKGTYRRPENEFLVDDHMFCEHMNKYDDVIAEDIVGGEAELEKINEIIQQEESKTEE